MAIRFVLHRVMAGRDVRYIGELARKTGIARATLSRVFNNRSKGVKLWTLERLCRTLNCLPGDLFEMVEDKNGRDTIKVA